MIILYGSEMWFILQSMENRIEGMHTEFLLTIMGKRVKQLGDGTWEMPESEVIQDSAGNQSARIYIEQWKATVVNTHTHTINYGNCFCILVFFIQNL